MSFVIAVDRFLSVILSDDAGDAVTAFEIAPTMRTTSLLDNHGIIFRQIVGGMALYYKTNPLVSPALVSPITGRVRFSFTLTAAVADPSLLYHGLSGAGGAQILLENLDGAGAIQEAGLITSTAVVGAGEHVYVGPSWYPVQVSLAAGTPNAVEARDRFTGSVIAQTKILDLAAEPPITPPPAATYVLTTVEVPTVGAAALRLVVDAPGTLSRAIYADDEVDRARALGVIDLHWSGPQNGVPAGTGIEYRATFLRKLS